jgi:hypothetical protein
MVSQRFSRSDFNCPALPFTASRLAELRGTPPSAPSPEELPQCLDEAILRAFPRSRGFRLLGAENSCNREDLGERWPAWKDLSTKALRKLAVDGEKTLQPSQNLRTSRPSLA